MISITNAEQLPSFWNRGPGELGNGLLPHVRFSKIVLDWIPGTGFRILCHWNCDSGFLCLAGFRIPWAEFQILNLRILNFIAINSSILSEFGIAYTRRMTLLFSPNLSCYYTLTTACVHVVTFSAWVVGRGGNPVVLVISKVGGGKVADGFDEFCWGIGPKNMDIW